jgi:hypothetical protein
MASNKYLEFCDYLTERNPECFHYIIAVTTNLDEAYLDVVNRVYESPEKARCEAKEILLKIVIKMLEDDGVDALEYLMSKVSKQVDSDKTCVCNDESCICDSKKLTCKEHPKYKGIRKPRSGCDVCWKIYKENHPDDTN